MNTKQMYDLLRAGEESGQDTITVNLDISRSMFQSLYEHMRDNNIDNIVEGIYSLYVHELGYDRG